MAQVEFEYTECPVSSCKGGYVRQFIDGKFFAQVHYKDKDRAKAIHSLITEEYGNYVPEWRR